MKGEVQRNVGRRAVLGSSAAAAAAAGVTLLSAGPSRAATNAADRPPKKNQTMILQPTWIMVPGGAQQKVVTGQEVVVKGDRIQQVRPRTRGGNNRRIDLRDQMLIPGLIAGHGHMLNKAVRGVDELRIDDGQLNGRRLSGIFFDVLDDAEVSAFARYSVLEDVAAGATTIFEGPSNLRAFNIHASVTKSLGVRSYLGSPFGTVNDAEKMADWMNAAQQVRDDLTVPQPTADDATTEEWVAATIAAAKKLDTGIQIHLEDSHAVFDKFKAEHNGETEVQFWDRLGMFSTGLPTFGFHLTVTDPTISMPLLAKHSNFLYAHDPSPTFGGYQPYLEALAYGVTTGIGFGARQGDFLQEMSDAWKMGNLRWELRTPESPKMVKPTPLQIYTSATMNPADVLNRNDLGRIEDGASADLASVRIRALGRGLGGPYPEYYLLYANSGDVQFVMSHGDTYVHNGELVVADAGKVVAKARAAMEKVWAEAFRQGVLPN